VEKEINDRQLEFRFAVEEDIPLILRFIRELAGYEKMEQEVVATKSLLREWIFEKGRAEVIFAVTDGKEIGFALFFHNFSTFLGRAGLYLEDLYVLPDYRGRGYGKRILQQLATLAVKRGCGRLEWWCLDWNRPSIDFYLSLGAEPMKDWTVYRIAGTTLRQLAAGTGSDSRTDETGNRTSDDKR
jgi:GNAT superfamily N-acetyltransferase